MPGHIDGRNVIGLDEDISWLVRAGHLQPRPFGRVMEAKRDTSPGRDVRAEGDLENDLGLAACHQLIGRDNVGRARAIFGVDATEEDDEKQRGSHWL